MHTPRQSHWSALKRLLRYLEGTIHYGLFLNRNSSLTISAFSDFDWGGVNDVGMTTTTYILSRVPILYHGDLHDKNLSLVHLHRRNTKLWIMHILNLLG